MLKSLPAIWAVLVFGLSIVAVARAGEPKSPSKWTCQDFLEVDDDVKPQVVYWLEGYDKSGKPEMTAVDVAYFDRPITTVVTECQKEPKASLLDKIKTFFSTL